MFVRDLSGILMKIEENEVTRYRYELWFDYTRQAMNTIAEGAMLAVPNFASDQQQTCYSILEVTGILPMHYALGTDTGGYPGFITEAARNAGQDWITQDVLSTEDTTKIRCIAVPTNLEVVEVAFSPNGTGPTIQEESNVPMVGHEVHLLDTAMTEQVANLSLDLENESLIQIGALVRDENVRVYLRVEELIKVHFGIFGFTGAGKSNLLSTLMRKLLTEVKSEPVKIVIFDLMSEYTGLLLDQLVQLQEGFIVNIGAQTSPESVITYYSDLSKQNKALNFSNLERATKDFVNSTVLPKALKRQQSSLHRPAAIFLHEHKMRFWQQKNTVGDALAAAKEQFKGNMGACGRDVLKLLKEMDRLYGSKGIDGSLAETIESDIEAFVDDYNEDASKNKATKKPITPTAQTNLDTVVSVLKAQAQQYNIDIPASVTVSIPQIVDWLNDDSQSSLIIVQSHNPDDLRDFAAKLSYVAYESRRRTGRITPLVSLIFDEADEFIPGKSSSDSQKHSKAAVMTLARRGRKFGLGIGISTQRIANLDVNTHPTPTLCRSCPGSMTAGRSPKHLASPKTCSVRPCHWSRDAVDSNPHRRR
ncbi:DUF87 domain-containing protein [Nodosilinea sp. FACHB-13]|uniref:ATP-binding protein n=1 Tax=Cyanophyceae TaxID=3028117 RepID=UPI0016849966|nr:DUF87 domain-containing protein [Nodosilinea sp. FACHB-13]MBD2106841.1 DUF87 domain-containing protein [Nodosilinea sp. FACHB-13]